MALPANALPYGLRDVKLTPRNADGTYGTMVDLPAGRTLSWAEVEDFEELKGDDVVQAERGAGPTVNWSLEQGGISLEAYAVLAGGVVTTSGLTPNIVKTYSKSGLQSRPYFRIDGQAINDNGGDTHPVIYKCKATGDIGGEFSEGSFELTSASGRGYPDVENDNELYDLVQNETAAAITQPV
jgi:hypothetical protein